MKRTILLIIVGAAIGGGAVWIAKRGAAPSVPAEKPAVEEEEKTTITHDTNGNVVINMSDKVQGDAGIVVEQPASAQFSPELKGYGKVLDPAPLAALLNELATAQAAAVASGKELTRLQTLSPSGNASARAVQAAEATALHDQLAVQSAKDRLRLAWGQAVADQRDLAAFLQTLASQETALVRVDLPVGQMPKSPPAGARIVTLSGETAETELLGLVPGVDPQTQGRGFMLLLKPNALRLLPGQGVAGFLKVAGEPLAGVIIPRDAVIRTEGKAWVYVLNPGGESLTRKEITLDRPTEDGWFIATSIAASDHVVVTGAQTLLSEELKATIQAD